MKKITILNSVLLLLTACFAGYEIIYGIGGLDFLPTLYYTIAFGILLLASLLLLLLGLEILKNTPVIIVTTLIPLSLSLGILSQYLPGLHGAFLIFALIGLAGILITRVYKIRMISTIVLTVAHGLAGLIIFILPIALSLSGRAPLGFALVGIGGFLVGCTGLMLMFVKIGRPLFFLSQDKIYLLFPLLLVIITVLFVFGIPGA